MKKVTFFFLFCAIIFSTKAQILLNESFENGLPSTWLNIDADYDGYSWRILTNSTDGIIPHTGDKCAISYSYDNGSQSVLYPNNYLITPRITVPADGATLTFWRAAQDPLYALEHYEIKVSTTGTATSNFTYSLYQETISSDTWIQRTISLASFAGQSIYIAFVHNNSYDQFAIKFDDIMVSVNTQLPDPQTYATIILEAHDVWGDGTGYQLLLDADAVEYANITGNFTCGQSYSAYEYMLPTYAQSNDWSVIANGIDSIRIPAGIYDYVVLNPGCTDYDVVFVASSQCTPAKVDDFYFEAGRRYHFNASLLGNQDCITFMVDGTPFIPQTQNVDLGVGFTDELVTMYIDTLIVNYGDPLSLTFNLYNWDGTNPSQNDYNDTLYVGFTFNGVDSGILGWIDFTDSVLYIGDNEGFIFSNFFTAAEIANLGLLGNTYECCIYLTLAYGWVDQELSDNRHCIDVIFLNNVVNTYTITSTAGAGGTISPSGTNTYNAGVNQTYTFTPNTCYQVSNVLVDGISVGTQNSYTFSNIQANHTISVTFAPITYTVSVTAGSNGSVTYGTYTIPAGTSQQITVNCGDQPIFTFHPNSGYQVNDVLVNGTSVGSPGSYQFPALTTNASINVSFSAIPQGMFSITASAGSGGTISPTGTNNYSQGANQTFNFYANTCYAIADVLVDGISIGTQSSYTFSNIQANHTIQVVFTQLTYTVTVTAGANGTISYGTVTIPANSSQTVTVNCGENPLFNFYPNSGYQVTNVEVNGSSIGTQTSYQFNNLTANSTLNVTFGSGGTSQNYNIVATTSSGGTISPSGTQNYQSGASQTYTITPNNCYQIQDVQVDGNSVGAVSSYTFSNIVTNHTINATFEAITYTIAVTASAGGKVDFNGTIIPENSTQQFMLDCGSTPTFVFIPNNGKDVIDVILNGNSIGAASQYQFPPLSGDATLEVIFGESSSIAQYNNVVTLIPNPTRSFLTIEAQNYSTIDIINYIGQIVYTAPLEHGKIMVNVKDYSNGIYFVRFNGENGVITRKFIKE